MVRRTGTYIGAAAVAVIPLLVTIASALAREPGDHLVVHEWGTFTSLHDEQGNAIGGINSDDEPVQAFVHRVAGNLIVNSPTRTNPSPSVDRYMPIFAKSAPRAHPDVTMRLETPVVYFHPSPAASEPLRVNLEVAFHGGWLSEYYPSAQVDAPGVKGQTFGPLRAETIGRLQWENLQVGTDTAGPETNSPVWLAPRAVAAANVTTTEGESERYLFYRGVGHVDSPLRVSRDPAGKSLIVTANFPSFDPDNELELVVPPMWLVQIRGDGTCAYRELAGFRLPNDGQPRVVATTPAGFDDAQFDAAHLGHLSSAMRTALIDDGLFADEADALLATWKSSYFESPGLRLFHLLPQAWTDHVLPMQFSVDATLVRTMVGRVEIVTPAQRELLGQIAAGPASNAEKLQQAQFSCAMPAEPADYRAYRELGRFRNALVLDELRRRPTDALKSFIDGYGLDGYVPAVTAATE